MTRLHLFLCFAAERPVLLVLLTLPLSLSEARQLHISLLCHTLGAGTPRIFIKHISIPNQRLQYPLLLNSPPRRWISQIPFHEYHLREDGPSRLSRGRRLEWYHHLLGLHLTGIPICIRTCLQVHGVPRRHSHQPFLRNRRARFRSRRFVMEMRLYALRGRRMESAEYFMCHRLRFIFLSSRRTVRHHQGRDGSLLGSFLGKQLVD